MSACSPSSQKKYLTRPSPPYPAQACPNQIKIGNDKNRYQSLPQKNGVFRWVKASSSAKLSIKSNTVTSRKVSSKKTSNKTSASYLKGCKCEGFEKPSKKYGDYHIIKEGFRPYTVSYQEKALTVYKNLYIPNKKKTQILENQKKHPQFELYKDFHLFNKVGVAKKFTNFSKIWLGYDTEQSLRKQKYVGNSILIQTGKNTYQHIANTLIVQFVCDEDIVNYYSPLDDETMAQPVATTKDSTLLFQGDKIYLYNTKELDAIALSSEAKNIRNDSELSKPSPLLYHLLSSQGILESLQPQKIKIKLLSKYLGF